MEGLQQPYHKDTFHQMLARLSGASAGERILDVGCGTGCTLPCLANAVGNNGLVVGMDTLPSLLTKAAEHVRTHAIDPVLVRADAEVGIPFLDHTFDRIVCNNVLECLHDKTSFLRECLRITRPGGLLLMSHFDFDSVVLASSFPNVTRRLVHGYADEQQSWMTTVDGQLGRKLPAILWQAGIDTTAFEIVLFVERELRGGYAEGLLVDMRAAASRYGVSDNDVGKWWEDLLELDAGGCFLFTIQWMFAQCRG